MIRKYDEDLFKDTTMTFGEHLEELRVCLWKAVLGIALGFAVGLMVGNHVVAFIQGPLERALKQHYQIVTLERGLVESKQGRDAGNPTHWSEAELEERIQKQGLLFEQYYVDARELLDQMHQAYPDEFPTPRPADGANGPEGDAPKDGDAGEQVGAEEEAVDGEGRGQGASRDDSRMISLHLWRSIDDDPRIRTEAFNAQEPFMIYIKASLITGILLSSPWVFYQIWNFVAAGLYPHEKHYVNVFLPFSLALFFAGASLAFFFVFEPVLNFLFSFNRWLDINPTPRISEWLSFVLLLPLGFGISFQLPLVMLFLERIGIFDVEAYVGHWRVAVLIIFILSTVLTPADPYSMLLMALPLTVLYFAGVLLCRFWPRGERELEPL